MKMWILESKKMAKNPARKFKLVSWKEYTWDGSHMGPGSCLGEFESYKDLREKAKSDPVLSKYLRIKYLKESLEVVYI